MDDNAKRVRSSSPLWTRFSPIEIVFLGSSFFFFNNTIIYGEIGGKFFSNALNYEFDF